MRIRVAALLALFTLLICAAALGQDKTDSSKQKLTASSYAPVKEYDPKRDAAKDVAEAVKEAQRTNRNVLVEIGGQWSIWCKYLDKFFADHSALTQYREENYVMVKVNFSPDNKNDAVISRYGKVPGYPHFFVLDKNGKLLHSQDTSKLEEGRGYNMTAVANFLKAWSPDGSQTTK
jgi:thioredoxin-related protein